MNKTLLITDYLNEDSLKCKVDGLIINSKAYSTFNDSSFSYTEIKKIIKIIKNNNFKVIINLDRIIPENEIDEFFIFLDKLLILDIDYIIYSDYSVLTKVSKKDYDKLIYDPKTLVCTKEELEVIKTKSFISSELSFNEIKDFNNSNKAICLDAFGYRQMMYSRRPLLSLVMPKGKVKSNKLYDLVEETRDDRYKIYEVKRSKVNFGTFIYNKGVYCLFDGLKEINNLSFVRINGMFFNSLVKDVILVVCNEYYNLLNGGKYNYSNILNALNENNILIDNTFLGRESVLLKECE